jgi:hypothetical protein
MRWERDALAFWFAFGKSGLLLPALFLAPPQVFAQLGGKPLFARWFGLVFAHRYCLIGIAAMLTNMGPAHNSPRLPPVWIGGRGRNGWLL